MFIKFYTDILFSYNVYRMYSYNVFNISRALRSFLIKLFFIDIEILDY